MWWSRQLVWRRGRRDMAELLSGAFLHGSGDEPVTRLTRTVSGIEPNPAPKCHIRANSAARQRICARRCPGIRTSGARLAPDARLWALVRRFGPGRVRPGASCTSRTVLVRPSSRPTDGAQPRRSRSFVAARYWFGISWRASPSTTGSRSARPAAASTRCVISSTLCGCSHDTFQASPAIARIVQALGDRQVRVDGVVDVEVVAQRRAVAAQHRPLAAAGRGGSCREPAGRSSGRRRRRGCRSA